MDSFDLVRRADDLFAVGGCDVDARKIGHPFAEWNRVRAFAGGLDASADLDLVDVALDLGRHDTRSRALHLSADVDRADQTRVLDAERDRLERSLDAFDHCVAFA